jgi:hypothetical protein
MAWLGVGCRAGKTQNCRTVLSHRRREDRRMLRNRAAPISRTDSEEILDEDEQEALIADLKKSNEALDKKIRVRSTKQRAFDLQVEFILFIFSLHAQF